MRGSVPKQRVLARAMVRSGAARQTRQRTTNAPRGMRAMRNILGTKFLSKISQANLPHTGTQQKLSQTQRSQRKNTEKPKHDINAIKNCQTWQNAFIRDVLQPNLAQRSSVHCIAARRTSAFDFLRTTKRNRTIKIEHSLNQLPNPVRGSHSSCRSQVTAIQETFEIRNLLAHFC